MGEKQTMPLSAIYPRHFGIAVQHVLDWTQRAVDNRALQATAAMFAADLPTAEEAYAAAVRDGSRCHFNDHDPGWRGMRAELPPKTTKVQRKLLFQRKRDVAGAEAVIIKVDSSDDEQVRTETSAGSCLELFTGAFPLVFDPAVFATHVVLKLVLEQQLALFFGPGHNFECSNVSAATSSRSLLDGLTQSWRAYSKYKFQRVANRRCPAACRPGSMEVAGGRDPILAMPAEENRFCVFVRRQRVCRLFFSGPTVCAGDRGGNAVTEL